MEYTLKTFPSKDSINWTDVPVAEISCYKWTDAEKYKAGAQPVFVKDFGFICRMSCEQSDPWARYTQNGDPVYLDSALEFFISLGPEGYLNFEGNCTGAHLIEFGRERAGRRKISDEFEAAAEKTDRSWTITYFLPFATISSYFPSIKVNDIGSGFSFRGNFYKTGMNPANGLSHYAMWNEVFTEEPDFHRPEFFGRITIG